MLKEFQSHIAKRKLLKNNSHILLAFSGGVDSVVLLHLLLACGYQPAIAHCNFKLRGKESDGDERFAKKTAEQFGLKFHVQKFDTKKISSKSGMSIQMTARQLRYDWFAELMKDEGYDCLLTAHHLNDNLETFLLNFIRGTGLRGLRGIPEKAEKTIRPLLIFERKQIEQYASLHKLKHREDSSNCDEKYARNLLRKSVLPVMKKLNPALEQTFLSNLSALHPVFEIAGDYVQAERKKIISEERSFIRLNLDLLQHSHYPGFLLYELLAPYGFNSSQCEDALGMMQAEAGKKMESQTYVLLKDRKDFLIRKKRKYHYHALSIADFPCTVLMDGWGIRFTIHDASALKIEHDNNHAYFDFEKVRGETVIRPWKEGDRFKPLGMNGTKKLSDFFVSEKMNLFEKEDCRLLVNDDRIMWVIGRRSDQEFAVSPSTKKILKAEII